MTEAGPVTHVCGDAYVERARPARSGTCSPNIEARIVDPAGGEDADDVGEMWLRGPQLMRGYLHDAEATARTLPPTAGCAPATSSRSTPTARSASSTG